MLRCGAFITTAPLAPFGHRHLRTSPRAAPTPPPALRRRRPEPQAVLRHDDHSLNFSYSADHTPLGVELRGADEATARDGDDVLVATKPALTQPGASPVVGVALKLNEPEPSEEDAVGGASLPPVETTPPPVQRIGVTGLPTTTEGGGVQSMRENMMRLVKESSMTGHLRLPTAGEFALFAWESSIILALVLLLRAGVATTLRWVHMRINAARNINSPYEESVWECLQRPLESVSVFTVGTLLAEAVSRPLAAEGLVRYLRTLRELGFIICASWFLLRWIEHIRSRFASDKGNDKAQVDATSRIATVATTIVSVLVSLDTVGINVQTVLAFGGIGGVAIGFAGREIISNFFGGFMIYVTRPFTVGEWVRSIEEVELNGTVEDIGWYLTRVRTWDKRPLYIPNSRFSTLIVENGSRMSNRRILHTLNLRLEDVPVIPQIVADLTKMLMAHSELDPRQHRMAYVDGFGAYSIQVWLSCYTKSVFLYDFRRVQQEVLLNAHEIIRSHGARIAGITTRDIRPGIDIDRYGPHGAHASYRTPSNEPKVGETPPPPRFKLSDIPGAPFFSDLHVDDSLLNIESGVSEESIAAALRMESPYPLPTQPPPVEKVPARVPQSQRGKQTSEAAVAAAAAALAAARRNQARMEEQNARNVSAGDSNKTTTRSPSDQVQTDLGKNAESGRTMKITAVNGGGETNANAGSDGVGGGGGTDGGRTMKITAVNGGGETSVPSVPTTTSLDGGTEGGRTMKITAVNASDSTTTVPSAGGSASDGGGAADSGRTMKITAVNNVGESAVSTPGGPSDGASTKAAAAQGVKEKGGMEATNEGGEKVGGGGGTKNGESGRTMKIRAVMANKDEEEKRGGDGKEGSDSSKT